MELRLQKMADVLLRLNIPMFGLRAQTYDGAANMSGRYSGAQAQEETTICIVCTL